MPAGDRDTAYLPVEHGQQNLYFIFERWWLFNWLCEGFLNYFAIALGVGALIFFEQNFNSTEMQFVLFKRICNN